MSDPTRFGDQAAQLGIALPEPVTLAIARVRAIDTAIQRLSSDQAATIDVRALEPEQVVRALHRVMHAEARGAARHYNAVHRLRGAIVAEAARQIRANGEPIVTAMRTAHDPLAAQLATDSGPVSGLDSPAALAEADEHTRTRWAAQPGLWQRLRVIHGLRFDLAELGYRLRYTDQLSRQLELMTRYVDMPADATRAQLAECYEHAEQQQWPVLLRTGYRLWLPTLDEQTQRIDALRAIWQAGRRANTGT